MMEELIMESRLCKNIDIFGNELEIESIENQILREIVRNIIEKMNNSPLYKTNLNGWSDNAHSDYGWSEHSDFYSDRY
jgi:2-phosphoglycerate kinase